MTTVPLSEAKDRLSALVEAVETTHEVVTITRHGREVAVLMAKSDLDSLHETIFWLSQPGVRDDVARARQELTDGRTVTAGDYGPSTGAWVTEPYEVRVASAAHRQLSRLPTGVAAAVRRVHHRGPPGEYLPAEQAAGG